MGAHTDTEHTEENPVAGNTVSFTITESGNTTITARTIAGNYTSNPSTETVQLDNIKPEITKISLTPEAGPADSKGRRWITTNGTLTIEATDNEKGSRRSKKNYIHSK